MANDSVIGTANEADRKKIGGVAKFQTQIQDAKNAYTKDKVVKTWYKVITISNGNEKGLRYTQYKNGIVKSRLAWMAKGGVVKRGHKPKDLNLG